ncbi:MAG: SpoIIE family protein phosphatase [Solirubrobacteraceae bacterium]
MGLGRARRAIFSQPRKDDGDRASLVAQLEAALQGSEQRLHTIIDALAESVTIRDLEDHIIYANRTALDQLGFESVEELRGAAPQSIMSDYVVRGENGGPISMRDIPSVRLLRGEAVEPLLIHTVSKSTGEEAWRLLKAAGLRSATGELEAAITIIEDVTESKRAALRLAFLVRASEILASSLDYSQTLKNVAQLAVPELADWCAVDLFDEAGQREPVAVAHTDPAKLALAEQLRAYEPAKPDPAHGLGAVLRTGESQLHAEVLDEMLEQAAADARHLQLLREVGMSSVLLVAMRAGGRIIGAMSFIDAESGRRFTARDVEFAEAIAARAAIAVENSRLYTARSHTATTLQQSLLPATLPQIPGWDLAALYRPAGPQVAVGGDFYDIFEVRDGWLILIGDVTGKGIDAAATTALLRHSARIIGEDTPDPASVLARLSTRLRQEPELSISTALCLLLGKEEIVVSSGGHPLPLVVHAHGTRRCGEPGTVLGAFADGRWENRTLAISRDDTLLLYTDGVSDTVGRTERFGTARLERLLERCGPAAPADLLACMDAALTKFQVGAQADDTAALALRRAPAANGAAG